jgi:hypothetical protein
VVVSSTDGQAGLPAAYTFTVGDQGTHKLSATLKTAGTQSLTATDSSNASLAGTQTGILVNPAAAARFIISAPANAHPGVAFYVTVTVVDAYGNVTPNYVGNVHFTSSDRKASLPADYVFTSSDNGVHTFRVIFKATGTDTLTATDTTIGAITGSVSVRVS